MSSLTLKCSPMIRTVLVIVLLTTNAESQRRWAGTYPAEPPPSEIAKDNGRQFNDDKHNYDERQQHRSENPHYSVSRPENQPNRPESPQHSVNRPDNRPNRPENPHYSVNRPENQPNRPESPQHSVNRPDNRPNRPENQPNRPESPQHSVSKPDNRPNRPESPQHSVNRPGNPQYSVNRPENRPNRPESPQHKPENRPNRPESPQHSLSRPDNRPNRPENPHHSVNIPKNQPNIPESPQHSVDRPENPQYSVNRPENRPNRPENRPNRPEKPNFSVNSPGTSHPVNVKDDRKYQPNTEERDHDWVQPGIIDSRKGPIVTFTKLSPSERTDIGGNDHRNLNSRKDILPPTTSGGRENRSSSDGKRVVQEIPKVTVPKDRNQKEEHESRDPFSNPKRSQVVPSKGGRGSAVARETVIGSNARIYPPPESDRRDGKIFSRNSTRETTFGSGSKDFAELPPITRDNRDSKTKVETPSNSRGNSENDRFNRGTSNEKNRQETRPKLEHPPLSPVYGSSSSTRKDDRATPTGNRKQYDSPIGRGVSMGEHGKDDCEDETPKFRDKARPPPPPPVRIPVIINPNTHTKITPEVRPSERDTPRVTKTKMEDDRAIHRPDTSYDIIVFPKDEDEPDYKGWSDQQEDVPLRNPPRIRTRKKREDDIHEDVEILPGYGAPKVRKEVLRNYNDEIVDDEIDIFSPVEIKVYKSR